jgi:hypothetical protein
MMTQLLKWDVPVALAIASCLGLLLTWFGNIVEAILVAVWLRLTSSPLASCYQQDRHDWCWTLHLAPMIIEQGLYSRMMRANALRWLRASYFQLTHSGVERASIQSEARSCA